MHSYVRPGRRPLMSVLVRVALTRKLNLRASCTHARTEHTQGMPAILVCILACAVLVPFQFLARPAAALSSSTAEQPAGAIVDFTEGLDARPRRHSKSGYIVQAEPGVNLKTNKASSHAAGASCQPPRVRAPCHQKLRYGAHATSNTKHTHVGATRSTTRNPSRNPFAENTPWP